VLTVEIVAALYFQNHHAQLLRILNDFGLKTVSQDYIFYVYDNPVESQS